MKRFIHRLRIILHPLCLYSVVGVLATLVIYFHAYSPREVVTRQPLPFSHATHTAPHLVNMQCQRCHRGAEQGTGAGLPADSVCMECHRHILPDDPRLLPLHAAANPDSPVYSATPVYWVRKAPLPAHVHFHHARHTRAGITCAECHPTPDTPTPHTMSACLDCHRKHALPVNCDACHH
ncbi:MAG: hypothetical protein E7031_04240 [Akkermansiaceae bacterium]|nr:hypothetical protein [Akkermansiaceae bacterium]